MRFFKKIVKIFFSIVLLMITYVLIAVLVSYIPVNTSKSNINKDKTIFLHSNGIHLSVIFKIDEVSSELKRDMKIPNSVNFVSYGWGNKDFYLKVPTWDHFKIKYAFQAFFRNGPTLVDVVLLENKQSDWITIQVSNEAFEKLSTYIFNAFELDDYGNKISIQQDLYPATQLLFKAKGSYSPVKTCNTWVNTGFKQSGLKASLWTLFDFGLLNKYE